MMITSVQLIGFVRETRKTFLVCLVKHRHFGPILNVKVITVEGRTLLLSSATDGIIALYDISPVTKLYVIGCGRLHFSCFEFLHCRCGGTYDA